MSQRFEKATNRTGGPLPCDEKAAVGTKSRGARWGRGLRVKAHDLLAVGHAAYGDVPIAVADGVPLQRGVDGETVILVRVRRELVHRPEVDERQSRRWPRCAARAVDADLGRLGEDVEACRTAARSWWLERPAWPGPGQASQRFARACLRSAFSQTAAIVDPTATRARSSPAASDATAGFRFAHRHACSAAVTVAP